MWNSYSIVLHFQSTRIVVKWFCFRWLFVRSFSSSERNCTIGKEFLALFWRYCVRHSVYVNFSIGQATFQVVSRQALCTLIEETWAKRVTFPAKLHRSWRHIDSADKVRAKMTSIMLWPRESFRFPHDHCVNREAAISLPVAPLLLTFWVDSSEHDRAQEVKN